MKTDNLGKHSLRFEARTSKFRKVVEFPIDEETERWLMSLQYAHDESSDFTVIGNGAIKVTLSIINRGLEF